METTGSRQSYSKRRRAELGNSSRPITELLLAQRNLQVSRSAEAAAIHRWNLSRAGLELETGLVAEPQRPPLNVVD